MPMLNALREALEANHIPYLLQTHPRVYSSQETAAVLHVPGTQMAKVVIVKKDRQPLMTVLAASHRVNFSHLQAALGGEVELAREQEFRRLFPYCETGAEPPFGNLFGLEVWVDMALTEDEKIVCNAGNHYQTVLLRYADFAWLVQPQVALFAEHV